MVLVNSASDNDGDSDGDKDSNNDDDIDGVSDVDSDGGSDIDNMWKYAKVIAIVTVIGIVIDR